MYLTATYIRAFPPTWLPYRNASGFGDIPTAIPFGIIVEVFSWGMQFVGHGFFEKRAPALLENLVQGTSSCALVAPRQWCAVWEGPSLSCVALVLAPFFVHLELLFALFNCMSTFAPNYSSRCETSRLKLTRAPQTSPICTRRSPTRLASGSGT